MKRIAVTSIFLVLAAASPATSQNIARLESQTELIRVERGGTVALAFLEGRKNANRRAHSKRYDAIDASSTRCLR